MENEAGNARWRACRSVAAALVAALLASAAATGDDAPEREEPKRVHTPVEARSVPAAYSVERLLRYTFHARNEGNRVVRDARLFAYAPVRRTSTQICTELRVSHASRLHRDEFENQVLEVELGAVAPYATTIVTIQAKLRLAPEPQRLVKPFPESYLKKGPRIESEAPEIVALGKELACEERKDIAKQSFEWIRKNVKPAPYTAKELGAVRAFKDRKGDCSEQAFLFCAVLRSRQTPARYMSGYRVKQNASLTPGAFHNWAEFHDGQVWRLADPQAGRFDKDHGLYVAFGVRGGRMARLMEGQHRYRVEGGGLTARMVGK